VTASGGGGSQQLIGNPGFENGSANPAPWTASSGVIDNGTSKAAHSGAWKAWLDGYGTTHTDTLMQQVERALPAPPVRVHFLADDLALRTRGSYFLYPQNVYHSGATHARKPVPDDLRSGDYVLLFLTSDLAYDGATQTLVWRDGRRKPADEILSKPPALRLVRVR